jgi:hypothetical protein
MAETRLVNKPVETELLRIIEETLLSNIIIEEANNNTNPDLPKE